MNASRWVPLVAVAIVVVGLVVVIRAELEGRAVGQLRITGGTEGGTYLALAREFAAALREVGYEAEAKQSNGSVENIGRLLRREAELGFVMGPALLHQLNRTPPDPRIATELRALTRLYADVVHVLVRTDLDVEFETFGDYLAGVQATLQAGAGNDRRLPRIFIGNKSSGTRIVATRILEALGFDAEDIESVDFLTSDQYRDYAEGRVGDEDEAKVGLSFREAAELIGLDDERGEPVLHAAFIIAGRRTSSVKAALRHDNVRLVSLSKDTTEAVTDDPGVPWLGARAVDVSAHFYANQGGAIHTLESDTYLVCREDLPEGQARKVLKTLFDHLPGLLELHTRADDIKLDRAWTEWPAEQRSLPKPGLSSGLQLHGGAWDFREDEQRVLYIAAGDLGGRAFELGREIRDTLEDCGISARVLHTDGSADNAGWLAKPRPVMAIMQLDAALAASSHRSKLIYGVATEMDELAVDGMRWIGTLKPQVMHVICRAPAGSPPGRGSTGGWGPMSMPGSRARAAPKPAPDTPELDLSLAAAADVGAVSVLQVLLRHDASTVCLGPELSGTQLVAGAILAHAKETLPTDEVKEEEVFLSVADMADRMRREEIRLGFFMGSALPDELAALVEGAADQFRLLSLETTELSELVDESSVFTMKTIERDDGTTIRTIATKTVLVVNDQVDDVGRITAEVLASAHFFGAGLTKEAMAKTPDGVTPHPDTIAVYQDAGLMYKAPSLVDRNMLFIYRVLAILVILIGGYNGLLKCKRDRVANEIGRRVLGIPVGANAIDSVERLLAIRDEIHLRVRMRWWQLGELDRKRWQYLHELIDDRVGVVRGSLIRSVIKQVRTVTERADLDGKERERAFREIERRIWEAFAHAKLNVEQKLMLRDLLCEARKGIVPEVSAGKT